MYVYMFITHIVLKVVTPRRFFTERRCMQINLDTYPTQGQYNIRTQSHSLGDEYIWHIHFYSYYSVILALKV